MAGESAGSRRVGLAPKPAEEPSNAMSPSLPGNVS